MTTTAILCGKCRSDITGPKDFDNDSVFTCPKCGKSDRYEDIVQEAQAYMEAKVTEGIDKQLDGIASSSRFITVTKSPRTHRDYKWILENVPGA